MKPFVQSIIYTTNIPNDMFKIIDGYKYIICKKCNGFGFTIYIKQVSNHNSVQDQYPCEECGSSGYIPMTWTEEIIYGRK